MAKKTPPHSAKTKASAKKPAKKVAAKKAPVKKAAAKKKAPTKKATVKKPAAKKPVKKAPAKKAAPKKTTANKAPVKKTAAKKPTTKKIIKKAPQKKVAPKKTTAKKIAAKNTVKKTSAKKPAVKKTAVKKAPAKSKATKSAGKKPAPIKSVKKTTTKKSPTKKPAAVKKAPAKTAAAKKAPATKKVAAKKAPAKAVAEPTAAPVKKIDARAILKSRILSKTKKPAKASISIAFSLDEVKEIAKTTKTKEKASAKKKAAKVADQTAAIEATLAAVKPMNVAAASLADILGFNPAASTKKPTYDDPADIPAKYRKYFKLLLELRAHLTGQIDQHSEDTLKRSAKDDAGDLSSYGQHMADAGTDTFDRDFALSMVANEQEALSEIEAAITCIKNGSYGLDEVTGIPIDKDRLAVVPFTRYSLATQKDLERNRHRVRTQAGLGGEMGEAAAAMADTSYDD